MPYRVRNWSDYNAGLKQRGSFTLWLSKDALKQWVMNTVTGGRGASQLYSDTAIVTVATLKSMFHFSVDSQEEAYLTLPETTKQTCLKMYLNSMGFRAIEKVMGVHHTTVIDWVKPYIPQVDSIFSIYMLDEND